MTIATDATQSLNEIWDAMGVQIEERGAYLAGVMGEVREVYTASVRRQCDRRSLLEAEVQGLQTTIEDMQIAMDESVHVVSGRCGKGRAAPLGTKAGGLAGSFPPHPTPQRHTTNTTHTHTHTPLNFSPLPMALP